MTDSGFQHTPVLLDSVCRLLDPQPGERALDLTVGGGGHAAAILERTGPAGRLIGVDRDANAIAAAGLRLADFGDRVTLKQMRISDAVASAASDRQRFDIVLADLGVSSPQLDQASRGFSFMADGPLDMRMDPGRGQTARDLMVRLTERELAEVFFDFGEERHSRRIARAIKDDLADNADALQTTTDLAGLIQRVIAAGKRKAASKGGIGSKKGGRSIHPATLVFQALRIAVNDELGELDALLAAVPRLLTPGGRVAVISFHSLEDRRVKNAFRDLLQQVNPDGTARDDWQRVTRRPAEATDAEAEANRRARSAKLRVLRRKS